MSGFVKEFFENFKEPVRENKECPIEGYTASHLNEDVANRTNINKSDKYGVPPLFCAIRHSDNPNHIKALIQAGADVNSAEFWNYGVSNEIFYRGARLLHLAIELGKKEFVDILLEAGADVNMIDDNGRNGKQPLHCAVIYMNSIIKKLVDFGADVNMRRDEDSLTPLFWALTGSDPALGFFSSLRPNIQAIKLLLEAGADVNIRYEEGDDYYLTVLDIAELSGDSEAIGILRKAGALRNREIELKEKELELSENANYINELQKVKLLLDNGTITQADFEKMKQKIIDNMYEDLYEDEDEDWY